MALLSVPCESHTIQTIALLDPIFCTNAPDNRLELYGMKSSPSCFKLSFTKLSKKRQLARIWVYFQVIEYSLHHHCGS